MIDTRILKEESRERRSSEKDTGRLNERECNIKRYKIGEEINRLRKRDVYMDRDKRERLREKVRQ